MNQILAADIKAFADTFPLWDRFQGRQIIVTGATGLLGACTVRCLLALNERHRLGLRVIAAVRNREKAQSLFGPEHGALIFVVHDFALGASFGDGLAADYLLHFASPTASRYFVDHPAETLLTAIGGTRQVLDYARRAQLEGMVYVSSLEVYGTVLDDRTPITEEQQGYLNPMEARSSYPMGKRAAECLCHACAEEYGVKVCVARLAQTFGAGVAPTDNRVFAQFARNIINKENIVLHSRGELSRCYCYTIDAVSALLHLLVRGQAGEAYNVANEETYISVIDMARMLCREFAPGTQPVIELQDGMGYSPVTRLRLSARKMQQTGWKPQYDLRTMFERLIKSMEEDL